MTKQLVFDVIEKTIGKYVRNLDTNSLNLAVWGGKVELHSLELNVDAVNAEIDSQAIQAPNLALPFRVVDGRFSSLEVDVPWTHLLSQPVKFRAKGLAVSVAPVDQVTSAKVAKSSAENEADRVERARQQSIATANDYRLQANALTQLAEQDIQDSKDGKNKGIAANLLRRILENLQIEISDVHVTLLGSEASAGVVLQSLRIFTTDETGKETYVVRTAKKETSFLHKSLVIQGLGAYIDEKATTAGPLTAIGEDDGGGDTEVGHERHSYVLAPLSFTAKLRQANDNVCIDHYKYLFESELSALSVLLSKTQLELARKIQKQMEPALDVPQPLFPEYRPVKRLTRESAKEWWRYAYRCVGRLNGRRSWVEFFAAFQLRNEYIELYKRHEFAAGNSWITPLSEAETVRLREIEQERSISVEGLMTWRNIADARAKKEMEKKESQKVKSSLFSSLFGRSGAAKSDEADPPITLSTDELKELETLTLGDAQSEDSELSKDSKLCDLKFVLGSFTVHLTTSAMLPLSTLKMGTVAASFAANADGSFLFNTSLQSLAIRDSVTPQTLFPEILSSQTGSSDSSETPFFSMRISKTKTGDQKLVVRLLPLEMIAPPVLVKELVTFASIDRVAGPPKTLNEINPLLRQSLSGSVDLFYDASEGVDLSIPAVKNSNNTVSPNPESDFSAALFDAWKAKSESNALWILDLDISAPVLIVPENCSKPNASILVLNLGQFTLRYGDIQSSPRVKTWYAANPYPDKTVEAQYDYGYVEMSSLLFSVGTVQNWKRLARSPRVADAALAQTETVLSPITAHMEFGVESHSSRPRLAVFLVLPLIEGSLSAGHVAKFVSVSHTWQRLSHEISGNSMNSEPRDNDESSQRSSGTSASGSQHVLSATKRANDILLSLGTGDSVVYPVVHFEMRLKRLSTSVSLEDKSGVEANLVSVTASATTTSDGNAKVRLSMGWFWILDRLESSFAREQRLVVHSALPHSADHFADGQAYDIFGDLENRGVFADSFRGSSELADIVLRHSPDRKYGSLDPFVSDDLNCDNLAVNTIVDAKFSSLHVNWNPYAIKDLVASLETFHDLLLVESESERATTIITPGEPKRKQQEEIIALTATGTTLGMCILFRAELEGIDVILRSALDDLPLFTLSMTETKSNVVVANGSQAGVKAQFSIGNLKAVSSELGQTCPSYRMIVGVSPGRSESLLTVEFWDGPLAIHHATVDGDVESYAKIHLSPMRMVYIQSQVLALVNYTTEGILGAVTAAAASSAASAAADLAKAGTAKKHFVVNATGFEVLVPEAAYSEAFMSIRTGDLAATYDAYPFPQESEALVTLTGVAFLGERGRSLLRSPSNLHLKVILPAEGVGTAEDQAIRTFIGMGNAAFCMTNRQYRLIMSLVSKNIGDQELYLRPGGTAPKSPLGKASEKSSSGAVFTHAGNIAIENPRRIYTAISLESLSLSLLSDRDGPLVTLTSDETRINADLFPENERLSTRIAMKNLECTDDRTKAIGREYTSLIYQDESSTSATSSNIISVQLETGMTMETKLKVSIGTPHLVFIPDAISDVLSFFDDHETEEMRSPAARKATPSSMVEVHSKMQEIETTLQESMVEQLAAYSISVATSNCCVVFVDLGSSSLIKQNESKSWYVEPATETFVVQGILDCSVQCEVDSANEIVNANAQFHAEGFEAYTAFGGSTDAIQVLEPSKLSMYVHKRITSDGTPLVDARLATVTPLDICLSMKNIALLSAIASGISDCFGVAQDDYIQDLSEIGMTQRDADQIEKLAILLEGEDESVGFVSRTSSVADPSEGSTISRSSLLSKVTLPEMTVTLVNDLQGLDDALFRTKVLNVVASVSIDTGVRDHRMKHPYAAFNATLNCSITADYFDESNRRWKQLLFKPWEITLRSQRGMNSKLTARIPSTTCDIESFACQMGFTEQFLMSLASANHMWTLYTAATTTDSVESDHLRRAIAASAARTLVTVLPYAIENHCGRNVTFVVHGGRERRHACADKTMEYFRFPQPRGNGFGGKRLYGQDRTSQNSLSVSMGDFVIHLQDVDSMVMGDLQSHVLPTSEVVLIQVKREGKTVVVHVSSSVDIVNNCSRPISVFVEATPTLSRQTISKSFIGKSQGRKSVRQSQSVRRDGRMTKPSPRLGVPIDSLKEFYSQWLTLDKCVLSLSISPDTGSPLDFRGEIIVDLDKSTFRDSISISRTYEIVCRPAGYDNSGSDPFIVQAKVIASLVDGIPRMEVTLAPRALIYNRIPLSMSLRTPMPHTYSDNMAPRQEDPNLIHHLAPGESVEIFTPGPSLAVSLRCTDNPVAGNPTDWMQDDWIALPLVSEFRLPEPFFLYLPFPSDRSDDFSPRRGGTEVVVADKLSPHWDVSSYDSRDVEQSIEVLSATELEDWREYYIGISFYAVDHTGEVLFEEDSSQSFSPRSSVSASVRSSISQKMVPIGAYRSEKHQGRITLLPPGNRPVRLLHLTMEGEAGYRKSAPFLSEDIAICDGGVESTNIPWDSGDESGFYGYRRLIDQYQSEIHIIPAFVVYNGSTIHSVRVKQPGHGEVSVLPGKIAPLQHHPNTRLAISVEYEGFGARTAPMNVDTAALRFAVARASDGTPIGSVAIETVVGAADSRWVVKLSDLKLGASQVIKRKKDSIFKNDLLRFRIQWTELRITLSESRQAAMPLGSTGSVQTSDRPTARSAESSTRVGAQSAKEPVDVLLPRPVCTLTFHRFTVDWQRVFKESQGPEAETGRGMLLGKASPERSQISIIIHNVQIRDETEGSKYPIVFDATTDSSVFDLCIRTRGPFTAQVIDVNLIDLKLSFRDGKARPVVLNLSEDFIWKLLDLTNRITEAASEVGGYEITLSYDDDHGGYVASISDHKASFIEDESRYTPPSSSTLYDFENVVVSPVLFLVSFDRMPQKSRYAKKHNTRGANLMNYFTRELKFKIKQAELRFGAFQASEIRGGSDRLLELLTTSYASRLKFKVVSVLSATSFRDWKNIARRQEGDDRYLEGDIMRVTGNLAGRSANFIMKKAGAGLGDGIKMATSRMGDGIESAAGAVGARGLGSGVNNIVSGVGQGVGDTLSGIGSGAGKVLKGAGQGTGQVFGGLSGGVLHVGKGIGRGLRGDARGFTQGMADGVTTAGKGTVDGVGAVVGGAAEGVATLGKGLFSGVKSIGKGFGGAVTGKPKDRRTKDSR